MSLTREDWAAAAKEAEAFEAAKVAKAGLKLAKEPVQEAAPAEEPDAAQSVEETPKADPPAEEPESTDDDGDEKPKDEKPVYGKERLKFRAEKRKWQEQVAAERKAIADERAKLTTELEPVIQAKRAVELGDFDGLAKAFGFKDWNEANKRFLEESSSPGYKRLRHAEEELERRRQADLEQSRTAEQRRAAEAAQAQRAANAKELAGAMASIGGLVADCAEDPIVLDLVLSELEHEFAGQISATHDEVIEIVPEVVERVLERTAQIHATWRDRFDKHPDDAIVRKVLGRRPSENAESRPRERGHPESRVRERENRGTPKPSHSRTSEAGGREHNDAEWRRQTLEDLRRSGS